MLNISGAITPDCFSQGIQTVVPIYRVGKPPDQNLVAIPVYEDHNTHKYLAMAYRSDAMLTPNLEDLHSSNKASRGRSCAPCLADSCLPPNRGRQSTSVASIVEPHCNSPGDLLRAVNNKSGDFRK